jgi:hypothetical protein
VDSYVASAPQHEDFSGSVGNAHLIVSMALVNAEYLRDSQVPFWELMAFPSGLSAIRKLPPNSIPESRQPPPE